MKYLIGLDIGTSGTKVMLFDTNGRVKREHNSAYPLYQPYDGWAEQDANDWWNAVVLGIKAVIEGSGIDSKDIAGIGLTGQMHGLVMLDKDNNVIRRAIIWCDQRSGAECEEITDIIGREELIKLTGNPAVSGFTLSKLMWVRKHEPENYARCVKILLPKDYIRYKLTGEFITDVSDAGGMQMLNINNRDWSKELLDALSIDIDILPKVLESEEGAGRVTQEAAELTGLTEGTIVAAGAGDQAAAAIGNGIIEEGLISITLGSSGVVFAMTNNPVYDPLGRVHTFCHAVKGKWHIMGVTQGAGLSVSWYKETFFSKEEQKRPDIYRIIDGSIERIKPGANGVLYLPYLMGERTPHMDPYARAVFFGMGASDGREEMARAVLEGISYSIRECIDLVKGVGVNASEIRLSGGGAKSLVWRQILADILSCKLTLTDNSEAGCLGAAILASVASNIDGDIASAVSRMVKTGATVTPDSANCALYDRNYLKYKALYQAVKDIYRD